jgi:protease YdgD
MRPFRRVVHAFRSVRFLLLIGAMAATTGAARASDVAQRLAGIGAVDHRVMVHPTAPPWSAIGRVNRRTGGYCTGTVVGTHLVLTAAHCLWNRGTNAWLPAAALYFVAGYDRGRYLAGVKVKAIHVESGWRPTAATALAGLEHDRALVTLDHDIGDIVGIVRPADIGRLPVGVRLVHAGYSQDRAYILTKDENCHLVASLAEGRILKHDCDATFGDSGSPLFIRQADGLRLVGMHLASSKDSEAVFGVAVRIRPSDVVETPAHPR